MKRPFLVAVCLGAAALGLYSCSMRAALATDETGRVLRVSAVRVESSLRRLGVAMLVAGGQVAFEFRWSSGWQSGERTAFERDSSH